MGIQTHFADTRDLLGNAVLLQKMIGHYQGVQLELLADFAHTTADSDGGFAHHEVATLLHITDYAADRRLRFALTLTSRLPNTLALLKEGGLEEYKAQLIAKAVEPLSDEHAAAVERRVLGKAPSQTPTQLRNALAKAVLAVDPEGAEERRREKRRDRRVSSQPTEDGMAMLILHHTAAQIAACHAHITGRARQLKAAGGEVRTLSEIEADVAADLLCGAGTGGRVVEVHLTVPAATIAGVDEQPGEVDGLPVTAQAARELAAEADRWRWIRTDPLTGQVTDLTYARYEPPEVLKTFLRVRDRTCRFPGCTRRARRCDIDHTTRWPDGATCESNCACLCRRHHRAKHEGGWQVRPIKPGWYRWTSPLGFDHVVAPEPVMAPAVPPPREDPPPF